MNGNGKAQTSQEGSCDGELLGPVNVEEHRREVATGRVSRDKDPVRREPAMEKGDSFLHLLNNLGKGNCPQEITQ